MDAGAYRNKIKIETYDSEEKDWSPIFEGYAYVNDVSGTEYWAASQVQQEETVVFTVRYHPVLDAINTRKTRIIFRGDYYNVNSYDNVMYKNETVKMRTTYDKRFNRNG